MDADERRIAPVLDVAEDQREMLAVVEHRLERDARELAPRRLQRSRPDASHELLGAPPVADQVGDRDEQQPVLVTERLELWSPCHVGLALADDLAQHAGRRATGEHGEVDRRLGVARPLEHAAFAGLSGKMWPGRSRSSGFVVRSTSDRIVADRSAAEIPVVVPCR